MWIPAIAALVLGYFITGMAMTALYIHAHIKTPWAFTKRPGKLRGTVLWPKLAYRYLSVKTGGAASDASCGGNCAVCPFVHPDAFSEKTEASS